MVCGRYLERKHRNLSNSWAGFIQFTILGKCRSERRLAQIQATSRPDFLWHQIWSSTSTAAQKKGKQQWTVEKTKLENARKLSDIYFIVPDDKEFNGYINTKGKVAIPMKAAILCKLKTTKSSHQHREIDSGSIKVQKSKHACIVEAHESYCGEGFNSLSHYKLVRKFVPLSQAMKISDGKAAVEKKKNWESCHLGKWTKKKKAEVILDAQKKKFILLHWWTSVISQMRSQNQNSRNSKDELCSEVTQWKTILALR